VGLKQEVIVEIFKRCKKAKDFVFDNELVKGICRKRGFRNPFDVTKISDTSQLPNVLLERWCER
jgi:hypothetical protein